MGNWLGLAKNRKKCESRPRGTTRFKNSKVRDTLGTYRYGTHCKTTKSAKSNQKAAYDRPTDFFTVGAAGFLIFTTTSASKNSHRRLRTASSDCVRGVATEVLAIIGKWMLTVDYDFTHHHKVLRKDGKSSMARIADFRAR